MVAFVSFTECAISCCGRSQQGSFCSWCFWPVMEQQHCSQCPGVSVAWQSEVKASKRLECSKISHFSYAKNLADNNLWAHSSKESRNGWGENLYKCSSSGPLPSDDDIMKSAVQSWADEVRKHFADPICFIGMCHFQKADLNTLNIKSFKSVADRGVVGHYTQEVWRKTTQVGCGVARGTDGAWNTAVSLSNLKTSALCIIHFNFFLSAGCLSVQS